jgi:hypothetical protein
MAITKRQTLKSLCAVGALATFPTIVQAGVSTAKLKIVIKLLATGGPVRRAVTDLAGDIRRVLNVEAIIGEKSSSPDAWLIEIATTNRGDRETFALQRKGRTITLSGADIRGTIYAIYQFCEEYLGVDPMYFWTDNAPARRTTIEMPDGTDRRFPKPVCEYRGFFMNDEDQLTGWAPAKPADGTNIAPAVMDKFYETLLRLKANMVVPSTWPFPDDPQIKAASARGLIVNQHHATPVGMNAIRWPKDVPYNFTDQPDILRRAWRNAVDLYDRDQEVLWTVGLRGLSDMPYAELDPDVAGNDAKMGALIGRAIAEQMAIVRARFPDAKFVTNLWSEGAKLKRAGHLHIPDDVIIAWPDEGWGFVRDDGQAANGQGFYYHVAMLNSRTNQLSEMVPVDRIRSEFGRLITAGATRFALVNVSDLRAVAMTAKTTMELAWGGVPPHKTAREHYHAWAEDEFGPGTGELAANFYKAYFRAIPRAPGQGWGGGLEMGDQHYHWVARELLLRAMIRPPYYVSSGQSPTWRAIHAIGSSDEPPEKWINGTISSQQAICRSAAPKWDAALKLATAIQARVAPERQDYFRYAVLTMVAVNRNSAAMLEAVCRAVTASQAGQSEEARKAANLAIAQIDELDRYKSFGTYGKWTHWWRGEWLTNIGATRKQLETFKAWLADPVGTTPMPTLDADWQGYYRILHYQGNRSVDVS